MNRSTRTHRVRHSLLVACFASLLLVSSAHTDSPPSGQAKPTLEDLAFIAGTWEKTAGTTRIEEHWLAPAANLMVGVGRTTRATGKAFFEFLRIESRPDGIFYIAQPRGLPPTEFKLTKLAADEAVFENPTHDHPKLIRYRRNADGSLLAQVEGDEKGKRVVESFLYKPAGAAKP